MKITRMLFLLTFLLSLGNFVVLAAISSKIDSSDQTLLNLMQSLPCLVIVVSVFGYIAALLLERRVTELEKTLR